MKSLIRYLIPLAGLAAALPALRAQDPGPKVEKELRVIAGPDDNAPPPPHHERRVIIHGGPQEMETVTFLGVSTTPAGSTLADQLGLPKDAGLVVGEVMSDSPAAGVLKRNDVLLKLDDQLLIDQRQLQVLVRNHKEGEEVTLTYIRGGKEATAKVKLAKHDVPKMAMMSFGPGMPGMPMAHAEAMAGVGREEMDRVLSLMEHGGPGGPGGPGEEMREMHIEQHHGPGMHSVTVNTSNSNMVFSDEQGTLDLTIKDGKKTLVAKNAKGEQLFSGPVNTPEERKALPADVRARLDKLEGMQDFSFKTDSDFKPGATKDARPKHQSIGLPLPPSAGPTGLPAVFF
jgi:hypothetical protein